MKNILSKENIEGIKKYIASKKKVCIFLDYDGTLAKIQRLPELAVLEDNMREIIEKLKQKFVVGIISGRELKDIKSLVRVKGIYYSGNHGLEIVGDDINFIHDAAEKTVVVLDEIDDILTKRLKNTKAFVEHKRLSLSLHYRNVSDDEVLKIKQIFYDVYGEIKGTENLQVFEGKKVFEVRPKIDWNKGKAIEKLYFHVACRPHLEFISGSEGDGEKVQNDNLINCGIIFIGDDTTDEDGFKVVNQFGGFSIRVGTERDTNAEFFVNNTDEVKLLLEKI